MNKDQTKKLELAQAAFAAALRTDLSLMVQPRPITVQLRVWPELVDYLHDHNKRNRKVKPSHVEHLAELMRDGKWYVTGQGFSVDQQGETIDSGHRTAAMIQAGYPELEIVLTLGVDRAALPYIDSHAKRSASDALTLMLEQSVQNWAAAAARLMVMLERDGTIGGVSWKPGPEAMAFAMTSMAEAFREFTSLYRVESRSWAASRVAAWMVYAAIDLDFAKRFALQVQEGAGLQKNSCALRLRNAILAAKAGSSGGGGQRALFFETLTLMRHARLGNETLEKLYVAGEMTGEERKACSKWKGGAA